MSPGRADDWNSQPDEAPVGRYRRLAPICQDTIGTTWLGAVTHGEDAGRQVLLTLVPQAVDSLAVAPLLAAATRELKLRHSAVLAFLDVELAPEHVLLVCEAMEGEPLGTFMARAAQRREPIPVSIALRIVKEAVDSLRALKGLGSGTIEHGLLNPETLFVASCGEVLLRQPELKAAVLKMPGYRRHGSILPYQAPEMLLDDREDEDCADVFSAGVLLWEMVAGRGLFGPLEQIGLGRSKELSLSEAEILRERVLSEEIPRLTSVVGPGEAMSHDTARLVDWMLMRDPCSRPRSLDELSRVFDSLPPPAIASGAQVGHYVRRLLGSTFDHREQLLAQALLPSEPPSFRLQFQEPQTLPRSLALAARLAREVPSLEDEVPPAAVVPIIAEKAPAHRDGVWATAAGVLLAAGLGGYILAAGNSTPKSATAPADVGVTTVVDEKSTPPRENVPAERLVAASAAKSSEEPSAAIPSNSEPASSETTMRKPSRPSKTSARAKPSSVVESPRGGFRPSGI